MRKRLSAAALIGSFFLAACGNGPASSSGAAFREGGGVGAPGGNDPPPHALLDPSGPTVETRFLPPEGYLRAGAEETSFAAFLRRLPLKPHGSKVRLHDGREKAPEGVYLAVVDLSLGERDLQQCSDAVIRLRAEYLFSRERYEDIRFNFLRDGRPRRYPDFAGHDRSYARFLEYLEYVFAYANTASLAAEMEPVPDLRELRIGDVFIRAGRPYGHAVIVVDMALRAGGGGTVFLLAQSYMPAQDIQVLVNPADPELSPWYAAECDGPLVTPEWTFAASDLRRFR